MRIDRRRCAKWVELDDKICGSNFAKTKTSSVDNVLCNSYAAVQVEEDVSDHVKTGGEDTLMAMSAQKVGASLAIPITAHCEFFCLWARLPIKLGCSGRVAPPTQVATKRKVGGCGLPVNLTLTGTLGGSRENLIMGR